MLKRAVFGIFFLVLFAVPAQAAPDFYGVQMKGEDFAQDIFLIESSKIPDFSNNRPGTDKRVYAYGYMGSSVGGSHGFSVKVFNHSDKPLATEKLFRGLVVVAYDGRRYDQSETEMMWARDRLYPGQEATFNFKFPGIRIERDEIRMVICSFGLEQASIYLSRSNSLRNPRQWSKKRNLVKRKLKNKRKNPFLKKRSQRKRKRRRKK